MTNNGTQYRQRDIVLVPFPYSDLSDNKRRPALIISNSSTNSPQDCICILITSNPNAQGILLKKKDFYKSTLEYESYVKPNRIFSVHKKIIVKKLAEVSSEFHKKVEQKICEYVALEK